MASYLNESWPKRSRNLRSWDKVISTETVKAILILLRFWVVMEWDKKSETSCAEAPRSSRTLKPVVYLSKFSKWNKLLLTILTVFHLIYRATKMGINQEPYLMLTFNCGQVIIKKFNCGIISGQFFFLFRNSIFLNSEMRRTVNVYNDGWQGIFPILWSIAVCTYTTRFQ